MKIDSFDKIFFQNEESESYHIMKTQEYNRALNIPFHFNDLLKLIKTLPIHDKLIIEKELEKETLIYRAKRLSESIKENQLDMDSIVAEVAEYRTGKK